MLRKKRRSGLFDLDRVKEKIEEENICFNRVKEQLGALRKFNVHDLYLVKGLTFTEDETLQILAAQLTFQGVCNLRKAIQHVPSNIVRITAGKSLRAPLIWDVSTRFARRHIVMLMSFHAMQRLWNGGAQNFFMWMNPT